MTFFSLPSNSTFAKTQLPSNGDAISSDTVITKDNVYKVLDYLGIDSNNLIMHETREQGSNVTVQELSEQLNQEKQKQKTTLISSFVMLPGPGGGGSSSPSGKGSATVSKNVWSSSGYTLTLTQTGSYNNGKWTSAGASRARVKANADMNNGHFEMDSEKFNAKVKNSGKTLWQDSTIKIDKYISILFADVRVSSFTNYATVTWGTNYIP